jgi:hypothetical protein
MRKQCSQPELAGLLHAYELGLTSKPETDAFEAHLMRCDYCLERLEAFAEQAGYLRKNNEVARAIQSALLSDPKSAARHSIRNLLWPVELPRLLRPAATLTALAAVLIVALIGWLTPPSTSVSPLTSIQLSPYRDGSAVTYTVTDDAEVMLSFAFPEARPGGRYHIELFREATSILRVPEFRSFDRFGIGRLFVPTRLLDPGSYLLIVGDRAGQADPRAIEYHFVIARP